MNKKVMISIGIIFIAVVFIIIKLVIIPNSENKLPKYNANQPTDNVRIKQSREKITMEVLPDTITRKSVTILITDNNEKKGSCGEEFKVQKKINNNWQNLEPISDMLTWNAIAYMPNENGQFKMALKIKECYGELSNGIYRIAKHYNAYNGSDILYSNEFEIK